VIKTWSFEWTCLHGYQKCATLAITLQIWRQRQADVPHKVDREQWKRNSKPRRSMHSSRRPIRTAAQVEIAYKWRRRRRWLWRLNTLES
jgi:hypothetical protein